MKVSSRLEKGMLAAVLITLAAQVWWVWGPNVRMVTGGRLWATEKTGFLKGGVSLAVGEVLAFKAPDGDAGAIKIERMTEDFGLDYVAWFRPASLSAEPLSKMAPVRGHVVERYWVTRTSTDTVEMRDMGTDQEIRCGKHRFVWRTPTTISFPDGYEVSVTDRRTIDTVSLTDSDLRWRTSPFEGPEIHGMTTAETPRDAAVPFRPPAEVSETGGAAKVSEAIPDAAAPSPTPPARRFVDAERGFSYLPPAGWSVESRTGMAFYQDPNRKNERTMASLFVSERPFNGSVDKRVETFTETLRKTGMDARIEAAVPITTESGLEGRKLVTEDRSTEKAAVQVFYFFEGGKTTRRLFIFGGKSRSIVVACTIEAERRAEFEPVLDEVIRSFRLERPSEVERPSEKDEVSAVDARPNS